MLRNLFVAVAVVCAGAPAQPVSAQTSTIFDPVGDTLYNAPAFQDFVFGQLTMTEGGDFEMRMELASPVPANPTLPPHGQSEIWWAWAFDLDPAASPRGYPSAPNAPAAPEYIVYVSWNGEEFAGTAIDRRPLLVVDGEAIVNPVEFWVNGAIVEAVLPLGLTDDFPASFEWRLRTIDYSGPVGSAGWRPVDLAQTVFNPEAMAFAIAPPDQTSTISDPVGDTFFQNTKPFQDVVFGQMTKTADGDFELFMEVAGLVPAAPPMTPPQNTEIWWGWNFDLDTTSDPKGYPWITTRNSELLVLVRWNGDEFFATAIDRRPLLTGGEAIVTPLTSFSITGSTLQAFLPFELIGEVPSTFGWAPFAIGWFGPVGTESVQVIDVALTTFNP